MELENYSYIFIVNESWKKIVLFFIEISWIPLTLISIFIRHVYRDLIVYIRMA